VQIGADMSKSLLSCSPDLSLLRLLINRLVSSAEQSSKDVLALLNTHANDVNCEANSLRLRLRISSNGDVCDLRMFRYKLDCVFSKDGAAQPQQPRQPKKTTAKAPAADPETSQAVLQRYAH
jgi:hypothetical protein